MTTDEVLKIKAGVVKKCLDESVTSVVIPEGVTKIGDKAFEFCESLSSVVIPEGVKTIGEEAFHGCSVLTSLSLPSTLKKIGRCAFKGCNMVESIKSASPLFPFDEKAQKLYDATEKRRKGILVLNAAKKKAKKVQIEQIQLATAATILDSILKEHPVERVQVRKETMECFVVVPAVYGGIELCLLNADVAKWMQTLPILLDKANENATEKELREYAKANDLTDASKKYITISEYDSVLLKKKATPVYLAIPEGVTRINRSAFYGCESLESVVIPEGVTTIGSRAFYGCKSLASVVIHEGVTEIGKKAFEGCEMLSSVEFCGTIAQWEAVEKDYHWVYEVPAKSVKCCDGEWQKPILLVEGDVVVKCLDNRATSVTIPEGVTEIGECAFGGCKSLSSVVIPASVTKIGEWAFYGCTLLSSVVIPECVTKIGEDAFYMCKSLASVVIPEGVTEIGRYVFGGCEMLSSVVIPASVTKIGECAFGGCKSLSSVVIPASVTKIGEYAFCGCKSLSSVVIPEDVTEIGRYVFGGCEMLSSVVIPASVTEIGEYAFGGCKLLSSVEFDGTMAQWEAVKGKKNLFLYVSAKTVKCTDGEASL